MAAPINDCVRKNFEITFVALSKPSLNVQIDSEKLILFQNGAT